MFRVRQLPAVIKNKKGRGEVTEMMKLNLMKYSKHLYNTLFVFSRGLHYLEFTAVRK